MTKYKDEKTPNNVEKLIHAAKQAVISRIPKKVEDIFPESEKLSIMRAMKQRVFSPSEMDHIDKRNEDQKEYCDQNVSARNFSKSLLHDKILLGDFTFFLKWDCWSFYIALFTAMYSATAQCLEYTALFTYELATRDYFSIACVAQVYHADIYRYYTHGFNLVFCDSTINKDNVPKLNTMQDILKLDKKAFVVDVYNDVVCFAGELFNNNKLKSYFEAVKMHTNTSISVKTVMSPNDLTAVNGMMHWMTQRAKAAKSPSSFYGQFSFLPKKALAATGAAIGYMISGPTVAVVAGIAGMMIKPFAGAYATADYRSK